MSIYLDIYEATTHCPADLKNAVSKVTMNSFKSEICQDGFSDADI